MSEGLSFQKRIYDLYSFEMPYDLEPMPHPESLYAPRSDPQSCTRRASADDDEDQDPLAGLDLSLGETESGRQILTVSPIPFLSNAKSGGTGVADTRSSLGTTLTRRKQLLSERIRDLATDIGRREKLEEQLLDNAELEGSSLRVLLGQVDGFSPGNYPSVDGRRTNLEREILALKKTGWDERLRCWRDSVMLKKELREALEEYHLILSTEGE